MAKTAKLKKRWQFLAAAKSGRKQVRAGFVLQARARKPGEVLSADAVGLGFTASKKVGNAVQRNRAKRRLRAVAAEICADLDPQSLDLVFIARAGHEAVAFRDLRKQARRAVEKLTVASS